MTVSIMRYFIFKSNIRKYSLFGWLMKFKKNTINYGIILKLDETVLA